MNSSNTARHLENARTYVVYVLLKGTDVNVSVLLYPGEATPLRLRYARCRG
jgi:hypothetical protein